MSGAEVETRNSGDLYELFGNTGYEIIDISQPVSAATACFPGDVPFSKNVTLAMDKGGAFNLTALTMSPHVGTHADAPGHICGTMNELHQMIGAADLGIFMGPVVVVDIAPSRSVIKVADVEAKLDATLGAGAKVPRLLLRTQEKIAYEIFEDEYAHFSAELVQYVAGRGCALMGIDTPSVDHVRSKDFPAHHALRLSKMGWLENIDLTSVAAGKYVLVALPVKFLELEASPLRAVLLR